jgi:hypothetical protein
MQSLTPAEKPPPRESALPPGIMPLGMSVRAACEYVGCSRSTMFKFLNDELLEPYYIGQELRFTTKSLDALVELLKADARERPSKSKQMRELRRKQAKLCNCAGPDQCTGAGKPTREKEVA